MSSQYQKYLDKLKTNGLSNSTPRKKVFEILSTSNHEPLTMNELIKKCSGFADRASIYRVVEILEKINVINKIHTGWKYKIELSDEFHGHHHHLICIGCHGVKIAKNSSIIEAEIKKLAVDSEFSLKEHSFEIYGFCAKCNDR